MANEGSASKKKRIDDDHDPDTAQKPLLLQRRRVWRACESCRRKKIKCDGCEPTCSQCSASGSQCTWLQTKDRAALSRHYVQELEARLLHMESLFSQIAPVLDQIGPLPNGAAIAELAAAAPAPSGSDAATSTAVLPRSVPPKDRASSIPIKAEEDDDVSESFGQLALDEYGHMRWIGGSSTMSLIQSFKALTSSPLHRISPMEEDPLAPGPSVNKLYFPASVFFGKLVHALPGPEEVEYPPRDLADKLVNAYFSRFHFLNPVIDKPSFLRKYSQLMDNTGDPEFSRSEAAFISLVFAVFACSARLVEDARLSISDSLDDGGMGMVYYERALILQYISHANTQIAHVQCFILLSSFLCSVNCLPQAWILVGQAVRTGQDLGLHRSPRRLGITPIDKETRRKIWWGVYSLDRMLALALGRPLGINDSDCDVEYPAEVDDEHLPEYFSGAAVPQRQPSLMTGSIALTSLYKIGGRVLREVYALENCKDHLEPERKAELQRTVESLDGELTKWCDDLPAVFKSQSETDEQVSMGAVLCSHYYSVLTTLHRNLLPVKRDQPVTAKSTVKAVSSARSCIRLAPSMKNVVPPSHHLAFFIQHLFSSAVILLLYAMHSSEPRAASAAMDEAKSSLGALESWEGHWPGARKCKELLMELTNTATEAVAKSGSDNPPPTPSAVPVMSGRERRRSVTVTTGSGSGSGSGTGRVVKNKPRRNQSRDPGTSTRRLAAVSPYRVDSAQRARSSSRKRGHDDGEGNERGPNPLASYYQSFASPTSAHAPSPHSSPASVNVPSPVPILDKNSPQPSPTLAATTIYNYPLSPTNTPGQYEYEYGMQSSQLSHGNSAPHWNGSGEPHGVDIYPSNNMSYSSNAYGGYEAVDSRGYTYGQSDIGGGNMAELSSTPPIASFAAPGLPFRGLEFIRNYGNGGGYSMGDQDSLWHSYDPGAFEYPDLPFTLGDMSSDDH
ncbi:fungal-specific transcription factor domain-containing protein [Mycena latifolia]|nr:fungal-specific transcription factor domain-containing protein [Mycena latifolia]